MDYIQRCGPISDVDGPYTTGVFDSRRLLRIFGVGRPDKEVKRRSPLPDERWRPPTIGLLTGMYGYRMPLAFSLSGSQTGIQVQLGTWSAKAGAGAGNQDRRCDVVASLLRGLYPAVALESVLDRGWTVPLSGLALGIPAPNGIDEIDGSAPVDRVLRSLVGTTWTALVLAYPVAESVVAAVRSQVLNEMRGIATAAKAESAPSPLAEQYTELLKATLASLGQGMATGAWRTGVYLLGDGESYPRLASAWRSVFSGDQSLPEPVRVFDLPKVGSLANDWALPDTESRPGPGYYRRPFEFQSLLTTAQLAAYAHLPELEVPGFAVSLAPRFDVVAKTPFNDPSSFVVGQILHNGRKTESPYAVTRRSLTRHVFVAGLTGSGKTNTIMALLLEAAANDIPFLVIEPAKTEYRALIDHPTLGSRMRVFTAGKAMVAPFVLNPFEVPKGITVSEHLDLLRAVFTAAFGMWSPLPQILELCLHSIYVDRGWDMRTNLNARLASPNETPAAFPTLSDLIAKAEEVVPSLGYDERVTGDMKAALITRLDSLRRGAKGAMLDVARSLPAEELFGQPTVVELEALGDEGDKAFFSGLLLIRLAEYRRACGQSRDLVHLLVVEEAHRLLSNVPTSVSEETANPRGEAVETFSNLLSEIRAYGQGVVIADQIPVRLAPDVVKNTNLKIAHRVVATDDRAALAGAMAMDERQAKALTSLDVGEAAVFSGGDDAPLLVKIPLVKDALSPTPPPDARVCTHMAGWRESGSFAALFHPQSFCVETCRTVAACEAARGLAEDKYVQRTLSRMLLSIVDEHGALDRIWDDLVAVLKARRPATVPDRDLLHAFAGHGSDWFARRRGAQAAWSYRDTAELGDHIRATLLIKAAGTNPVPDQLLAQLEQIIRRLHARTFEPYPACHLACTQDPPVCLYRSAVADLVISGRYHQAWRDADDKDANSEDRRSRQTWEICQDAAYELIEFPTEDVAAETKSVLDTAARRVCICFEQQMLADDRRKPPRAARRILARVLKEAGL
ncbi:ATP-binding protein [Nocardia sp. 2YAB30]|uniref:ATP-binding protein n=1 Tax=unclassified Nocardia TaxID=2637762 RepID=UPI003F95374A